MAPQYSLAAMHTGVPHVLGRMMQMTRSGSAATLGTRGLLDRPRHSTANLALVPHATRILNPGAVLRMGKRKPRDKTFNTSTEQKGI